MTRLEDIQRLQFTDKHAAEQLLHTFIEEVFSMDVVEVALRPLAVSLNSFNGTVVLSSGARLFFKSHVEPGSVINEYYNSELLEEAGYPVIRPVAASTEPGKQMLLYELVEDQSVFDLAWMIERNLPHAINMDALTVAQKQADRDLLAIYEKTLRVQSAADHGRAPVHQLFYHRLSGGRLDRFYGSDAVIRLPDGGECLLADLREKRWIINGVRFAESLNEIIERAKTLLQPAQEGPAIVGHGDAHNGNVFMRGNGMVYFDPAFAGIHDPLLDLVKPLYHNVRAMWMYFPEELEDEQGARLIAIREDEIEVEYPTVWHPIRQMFWESKTRHVLLPLIHLLKKRKMLRTDWREFLRAGLACCPLLTMNLADRNRFPPAIALRGFAEVVAVGGTASGKSDIEQWLDAVEEAS